MKEGSRPVFKAVTGVSRCLTAPFAFLGKEYDERLERLYTTMSTKDVMASNGLLVALSAILSPVTGRLLKN